MPHAQAMPSSGFQALILCGPGVSLNTFTSTPEELPKALIPIANRPMVWYPLDWCYRMGITGASRANFQNDICPVYLCWSTIETKHLRKAEISSSSCLLFIEFEFLFSQREKWFYAWVVFLSVCITYGSDRRPASCFNLRADVVLPFSK